MNVACNAKVIVGDYKYADSLNKEVLHQLKYSDDYGHTNVKASLFTGWNWLPDNKKFLNFKSFIKAEIKIHYDPDYSVDNLDFWANVYKKGDYADKHDHLPVQFSFAYFVKAKWYDSPLIFSDSGKKIRPKEGRYIIFPSYLKHSVPKHRYNHERITLSGNYLLDIDRFLKPQLAPVK